MKILVATEKPFAAKAVEELKKVVKSSKNELVLFENYSSGAQLESAVVDCDALIIRSDKVTKEVLEKAKKLKIVVRAGAGYDNVDLEEASKRNMVVMNTPGQNSMAVAELTFGMMIMAARGGYDGKSGSELSGKKIGIHAYGNIGKLVAQIAKGFEMDVYIYHPSNPKSTGGSDMGTVVDSAEKLYSICEYISLHIPANEKTKNSINYELVSKMPKGGTLINTARKEIIDELGLIKLMSQDDTFKYYSDLAPKKLEDFKKFGNRFFCPPKKMGAQTSEANIKAAVAAAKQIIAFFEKGDTTFMVNK